MYEVRNVESLVTDCAGNKLKVGDLVLYAKQEQRKTVYCPICFGRIREIKNGLIYIDQLDKSRMIIKHDEYGIPSRYLYQVEDNDLTGKARLTIR